MRKIPTVFERDWENNPRHVIDKVTPGCEWVMAGEGRPTRKYDGICILIRRDGLIVKAFVRREVKAGKAAPAYFVPIETDPVTGDTVGWEPASESGFYKFVCEALTDNEAIEPGTYELIGPKINRNPEGHPGHFLIRHGAVELANPEPITFETLRAALTDPSFRFEGVVWHHTDGRMAKLKKRDFV